METQVNSLSGVDQGGLNPIGKQAGGKGLSGEFEKILQQMLRPDVSGKVNEEQLYGAVLNERLASLEGEDVAARFQELFEQNKNEMTRTDGYVPVEDAANKALNTLVEEGLVASGDMQNIKDQAFKASQLDTTPGALYDSRGNTVAVAMLDMAIAKASNSLHGTELGALSLGEQTGQTGIDPGASLSGQFQGGDGFLFKPISESNGNLAILLPGSMKEDVAGVTLQDGFGNPIEDGQSFGIYEDGRPLFRFDQPGSGYPDGLTVQVRLDSGEVKEYFIPDPSQRWE